MVARIVEVDVLRGFALFGISVVNAVEGSGAAGAGDGAVYWGYETLLHQRFFPIFSFLFGVSFGLFLDAVGERSRRPRVVMLARLGFLMLFGALHRVLQPDEVLLSYAVVGVVVLVPASFLSGRVVLALGSVATAAGVLVAGGGSLLIPGLFLFGYGVQRGGVEGFLELARKRLVVVFVGAFLCAVVLNVWQVGSGSGVGARLAAVAGVVTAATYVIAILLLLRWRARGLLGVLAPVGRMALTGYIGATLIIWAVDYFVEVSDYGTAVALGIGVFLAELAFSTLWLRHARYGPLEWVWRCLTWWDVVPIRGQREPLGGRSSGGGGRG
ncbi:DUF418 domain-containing protein [Actinomadura sp. 1N219]|uniref:DUF418 domain-containing protein n=1 Tax=Actinomadura sp. 1N219 TaxID=3375152 RepID=UPI00378B3D59